jgi:hypothetical protein
VAAEDLFFLPVPIYTDIYRYILIYTADVAAEDLFFLPVPIYTDIYRYIPIHTADVAPEPLFLYQVLFAEGREAAEH